MWQCRLVVASGCKKAAGTALNLSLITLSGQIILAVDPCLMGVEMRIQRFDMIVMIGNADGV